MALKNKIESAFKSLITTAGIATPVIVSSDVELKEYPAILVDVTDANEAVEDSGIYAYRVEIMMIRSADPADGMDDPGADQEAKFDAIRDAIKTDDLPSRLTAAQTDFHCYDATDAGLAYDPEGRLIQDSIAFEIVACESDL